MNRKVTLCAYAKLNLYLDIVGKREDGYHELEGVMQAIDLHDRVTVYITDTPGITVTCDNPEVPTDNNSVAYKAAELFIKTSGLDSQNMLPLGVAVDIKQQIPAMAGLGGSSADGAAVLAGLNHLFDNAFSIAELCDMGVQLGADVPFCLTRGTAICRGIGEVLTPLPPIKNVYYVIVKPDYSNSTKELYEAYDLHPKMHNNKLDEFITAIKKGKFSENLHLMYNVFQSENDYKIHEELYSVGAKGTNLTGTGSAVFGVFEDFHNALAAYGKLDFPFKYIACNLSE
ncbi:MAG: 4-(cytidine 5'-diphospho)-2-C-methyl-D-erythritol kinase [Oscillospiraceae bacterium]|nr:4-(cytidine 5'-diphospho)-2-C-methyl-D-erythritol kinase [Oscillospiraceae bacterium]